MANPSSEEKRKNKGRLSVAKKFSSKKKNKKRQSKTINNHNNVNGEGTAEVVSSSGSFHETSEELNPELPSKQAQHEEPLEETEDKHQPTEKKDRRKSKHHKKGSSAAAHHPKKNDAKVSAKKSTPATKLKNGHAPDHSNAPASAYGLNKKAEGKQVQYTVNDKGESVQFSIDQTGAPELWLQVDHDQCLVSPMTINSSSFAPASSSSLSTTQQSWDENHQKKQPMSTSKQDLFMKTSLLTIGEGGKEKNGVRPKAKSLMGEQSSGSDEDSIAAEEKLLNQYDDNYKKASELPKPKGKKKGGVKKKKKGLGKKEKDKDKKKRSETMSGDEDDRIAQPQSSSVVPSAKIPSLEERSSIKLPAANKNGKSGKKTKKKSEKIRAKDTRAIEEEEQQQHPESPIPPPPSAETTPPSSGGGGGGRRVIRRIQRINSVPASAFSSPVTSSPDPKGTGNSRRISSATVTNRKTASSSSATRSSTYESPRRMNLKDLRKRFGAQQSETFLTMSPAALAAANYGDLNSELQAYGRPSDQRSKRPGLKRKEYRMSQRSLRNLTEQESSVSDDEEDENLVAYLKNSNYKLDL